MYTDMNGSYLITKDDIHNTNFYPTLKRQKNLMISLQLCSSHPSMIPQKVSLRMMHYSVCVMKGYHISEILQRDIGSVFAKDFIAARQAKGFRRQNDSIGAS